jgi:hypothetical protein
MEMLSIGVLSAIGPSESHRHINSEYEFYYGHPANQNAQATTQLVNKVSTSRDFQKP